MRLGIDFGTTHTVVTFIDRGNYPVVSFESGESLPSLFAVRQADGECRIGPDAALLAGEPGWVILRSFKRLLYDAGQRTMVSVGRHEFLLTEILERYMTYLRRELVTRSNLSIRPGEPLEVAVSVPANASSAQRFLTVDAFQRAGFTVASVLNEPSAAAFEYAHRFRSTLTSKREYVLVYDLGGGTFDAALIHMAEKMNEVVTSGGVPRLGGDDFDEAMYRLVADSVRLDGAGVTERAALLDECRRQKEAVGPNTKRILVDMAAVGREPLALQAEDVFDACRDLVQHTIDAVEPVMRDPRREEGEEVPWNEIAGIYVVGGASSFPAVYRTLRERFGSHRVRRSPYPFAATAIGLAISLDEDAGYTLSDRLSRHFGVWRESGGGEGVEFDVVLAKDSPLPRPSDAPHEEVRRYRAAHNIGHYRFVECGHLRDGRPDGHMTPWDEIRFPFDPALRSARDLAEVAVSRLEWEGPEVEEKYRVLPNGAIEVAISVLDDGYSRLYQLGRHGGAHVSS